MHVPLLACAASCSGCGGGMGSPEPVGGGAPWDEGGGAPEEEGWAFLVDDEPAADEAPAVATAPGGSYWVDDVTPSRSGIEESYREGGRERERELETTDFNLYIHQVEPLLAMELQMTHSPLSNITSAPLMLSQKVTTNSFSGASSNNVVCTLYAQVTSVVIRVAAYCHDLSKSLIVHLIHPSTTQCIDQHPFPWPSMRKSPPPSLHLP